MDLRGSLVDTNVRVYPTNGFSEYIKQIKDDNVPVNVLKFIHGNDYTPKTKEFEFVSKPVHLTNDDIELLKSIKEKVSESEEDKSETTTEAENELESDTKTGSSKAELISKVSVEPEEGDNEKTTEVRNKAENESKTASTKTELNSKLSTDTKTSDDKSDLNTNDGTEDKETSHEEEKGPYLTTSDINWLYHYLLERRTNGENVPYLHELLEGAKIEMPENKLLKRNPDLEARCVKLRAQQEAREYRKMTKGVDNVRMRFPEDSISYQLKQVNRQLIAIGQFIISIFAGFLFGFKGVEWMLGSLDFGFRLLLGVMCALVIALAEIYFLAKKLNEELNIPETVQLGGPPKFVDEKFNSYMYKDDKKPIDKEHQD